MREYSPAYLPNTVNNLNEIDGTEQELNSQTIMDEEYTNIGKAITLGSFYAY